mmetsp:Transcript_39508/g.65149  ORF Transcript_39508/g.65149 Transcript_39508/m.65149 type:complete len:650 (-) Transcript_39508:390-2339(-)
MLFLQQATSRYLPAYQHPPVSYVRLPYEVLVPLVVQAPLPLYLQGQSHLQQFLHPTSLFNLPHPHAPYDVVFNDDAKTQEEDGIKEEEDMDVPPVSSKIGELAAEENLPAAPKMPQNTKRRGKLCERQGCNKARHFGHKKGEGGMQFCGAHKEPGMVNLSRKTCEFEGCARPASHGCPIQRKKMKCLAHKKKGMINLALKRCLHPGCSVSANYTGPSNDGRRLYCFKHKGERVQQEAAVQRSLPTTAMMAQHAGHHSSTPAVGTENGHPVNVPVVGNVPSVIPSSLNAFLQQATSRYLPAYQHPPVSYVRLPYEVLVPLVVQAPLPLYLQGQSHLQQFLHPTSLFNLPHPHAPYDVVFNDDAKTQEEDGIKEEEDMDVPPVSSKIGELAAEENLPAAPKMPQNTKRRGKLCERQGCNKARHFGHKKGEGGMQFCGAHKEPGMVNLSRKTCEFEGCARPASHGCPIQRKKICCSTHSKKGMVNLLMQVCLHPGCGKSAKFKGGADGKFLYCGTHKEVITQSKAITIFEAQQVMIKKNAKYCENDSSSIPTMPGSGCCLPVTTTVTKDVIEVKLPENSEEDRRTPVSRKNRAQKHPRKTDRRKEEALPTCGDDSFSLEKVKTIIAASNTSCSKTSTNGHTSWGSLWGKISA